ncbi:MAG: 4-hydroxy-tetrahydrodipicolinate synthase [Actinomycetes bacterium]|jgi:4-hydroxy-tetrahydrodipicolinate synthase|nr:4-hydroxy-tetrahydrodipicolinate synthase [Actinomycetes bacterium]
MGAKGAQARFGNLLTAMVTPFNADESLDLARAGELARMILDEGSQGLIVNGTTGESPTISRDERCSLFQAVIDAVADRRDRISLVANVGDNCTADSVDFARRVAKLGVDGLMVVTPYYNKPPQEGLYRHFSAVAAAVDLPIVLYNIPGRCVINIEPDTIIRLARDVDNIVAVKQANPDMDQLDRIIAGVGAFRDDFEVLSGDDALTLDMMDRGGTGVISTIGNIASGGMRAMVDAQLAGDTTRARTIESALLPLMDALFITANPIMVKRALELRGFPVGPLRLPLLTATDEQTEYLRPILEDAYDKQKALDL